MKLETTAKAIIEANITQIQIHTEVKDNYEVNKGTVELAKILNKLSGKKKTERERDHNNKGKRQISC